MDRLTFRLANDISCLKCRVEEGACLGMPYSCPDASPGCPTNRRALNRLADYVDIGLTPEEIKAAIVIAERIATADYPHNFQRERSDIVDYMRWITDVMQDAKAWWNSRIRIRAEAEKALEENRNE